MIDSTEIQRLLDSCQAGHTLPQAFYCEADVFSLDHEKVFGGLWHIAGHASRIPNAGDYFLFRICREEIIIVRGRGGAIFAHYNVCRHRGSRICRDSAGNRSALVCPYHAWTYNLDGSLRKAQLMGEDFDPADHGLHPCQVRVVHGIIFICLAEEPASFEPIARQCSEYLDFHGIDNAKIAKSLELPTHSNWKLVVENFIECYHCISAHPEYCSVHSELKLLAAGAGMGSGPEDACRRYQQELNEWKETATSHGCPFIEADLDDGAGMTRMPIRKGYLTESRDGQPVSTLMGKFADYDGGVTYIAFNYMNYLLASNDHAVLLRFTPRSELLTDVEAVWLVDMNAREGDDYDPARVSWVWDVTLQQDAAITDGNQAGILSSRYRPGPYSDQERMNAQFTEWYRKKLECRAGRVATQ